MNLGSIINPLGLTDVVEFQAKKSIDIHTIEQVGSSIINDSIHYKDGERVIGQILTEPNYEDAKSAFWKVKLIDGKEVVLSCNHFVKVSEKAHSSRFLNIRSSMPRK